MSQKNLKKAFAKAKERPTKITSRGVFYGMSVDEEKRILAYVQEHGTTVYGLFRNLMRKHILK